MSDSKALMPNLGELELQLVAKDDARFVRMVRLSDIATGKFAMPFGHPWFALDYYKNHNSGADHSTEAYKTLVSQLEVVYQLSCSRNHRLMAKGNTVLAQHPGKKLFVLPEAIDLDNLRAQALALGVDTSKYLDETTDEDDLAQCTNDWNLNQNLVCGKAADNVQIITDLDGIDWLVLIVRQFGPGRSQLAWAGGFVDKDETFKAAALREKDEETSVSVSGAGNTTFDITTTELASVRKSDWDPRVKFVEGMEVGAVVTHYRFRC
jgi:hypothetical protein